MLALLRNLRIKKKLLSGFLTLSAITVIVGGFGTYGLMAMKEDMKDVAENNAVMDSAAELVANVYNQRGEYRSAALNTALGLHDEAMDTVGQVDALRAEFAQIYDKLMAGAHDARQDAYMQRIAEDYAQFSSALDQVIAVVIDRGSEAELLPALDAVSSPREQLVNSVTELMEYSDDLTQQVTDGNYRTAVWLLRIMLVLVVLSIFAGVFIGIVNARSIAGPVNDLVQAADQLAMGNVDVQIDTSPKDEIGDLARSFAQIADGIRQQADILALLAEGDYSSSISVRSPDDLTNQAINHMIDSDNKLVGAIRDATFQVKASAKQIAQAAQDLANGASEQAATIEEFSAALYGINEKAKSNAQTASHTLDEAQQSAELMEDCHSLMDQMLTAMGEIDQSAQNISKVIKIIDDIAFQTNILALNAAVEAARAGQHGKGFAVVADEVRNLASKSAEAAKETTHLIDLSIGNVAKGNNIVTKVNESMQLLGEITRRSTESVQSIHGLSLEQSASMEEITLGITQISSVVQTNSATAEETAASSEQMSAQSELLGEIIAQFTLRDDEEPPVTVEKPIPDNIVKLPAPAGGSRQGFSLSPPKSSGKY